MIEFVVKCPSFSKYAFNVGCDFFNSICLNFVIFLSFFRLNRIGPILYRLSGLVSSGFKRKIVLCSPLDRTKC